MQFPYKEMLQTLNSFAKTVEKYDLQIDLNSFKRVLADIEKSGSFGIGAEWTLRYISQHGNEFAGKMLYFEVIEKVGDKVRRVDLNVYDENLERNIFYEFKSVQGVPPDDFFDQFGKDLLNEEVKDLSQLKWIFDGKKVAQEQLTETMRKTIDNWSIPDDILTKWGYKDAPLRFKNEKLLPSIENIFNAK